jgi:Zn-finger nucleic acid-binding protein
LEIASMKCPKDGAELVTERYEGEVHIESCPSCGGNWAESGEIERIQALRERDHLRELREQDDTVGRALEYARQSQVAPGKCPVCSAEMAEEDYGYGSGVLVERCPAGHGVWLDVGELESLEIWFERNRREAAEPVGILGILGSLARRFGG